MNHQMPPKVRDCHLSKQVPVLTSLTCGSGCPRQGPDQILTTRTVRLAAEMPIRTMPQRRARRRPGGEHAE
jgi:hypothetical protein